MALKTASKNKAPQVQPDTHPALVAQIIDLGNQFKLDWQTQEIETYDDGNPIISHEVWVTFEFPTVTHVFDEDKGAQPLWVSKRYTMSTHDKAKITELLSACSIKDGDLSKCAGKVVAATTGLTSGGNAKIEAIAKAKPSMLVGEDVVKTASFELHSKECVLYEIELGENGVFNGLPDFLKEIITNQATKEAYFEQAEDSQTESEY